MASLSSNSGCYFLQLMLHFLPLQQQQSLVCAFAVETPNSAARLTIKRRYFIQFSCLNFSYHSRLRDCSRADPLVRRHLNAAAERADDVNALSHDRYLPKLIGSFVFARKMHLRCQSKGADRRPARCNMRQSSKTFRRD